MYRYIFDEATTKTDSLIVAANCILPLRHIVERRRMMYDESNVNVARSAVMAASFIERTHINNFTKGRSAIISQK